MKFIKTYFSKDNIASWLALVANFGSALIVIPCAYLYLTENELALWFSMSLLVSISYFSDFGSSFSLIRLNQFARAGWQKLPGYGKKNRQEKTQNTKIEKPLLRFSFYRFLQSNIYFVGIGALICYTIYNARLSDEISAFTLLFICLSYLLNIPIQNSNIFISSIFQSRDRVFNAKMYEFFGGALRILLQIITLIIWKDILLFALSHLIASFLSLILGVILLSQTTSMISKNKTELNDESKQSFRKYQFRQGGLVSSSFLIANSGGIIISQASDPVLVSSYFLTLKIILVLKNACQVPILSKIPILGKLRANNHTSELVNTFQYNHRLSILLFTGLSVFSCTGLLILQKFYNLQLPILENNLLFLMLMFFLLELNHGNHAQLYLTNNHHPFLIPAIVSGIFILVLSWMLIGLFGVIGLIMSHGLIQLLFNNWYPIYLNKKDLPEIKVL